MPQAFRADGIHGTDEAAEKLFWQSVLEKIIWLINVLPLSWPCFSAGTNPSSDLETSR